MVAARGELPEYLFFAEWCGLRAAPAASPNLTEAYNIRGIESGYLGVILLILLPCMPRPAISPFCPKTKA